MIAADRLELDHRTQLEIVGRVAREALEPLFEREAVQRMGADAASVVPAAAHLLVRSAQERDVRERSVDRTMCAEVEMAAHAARALEPSGGQSRQLLRLRRNYQHHGRRAGGLGPGLGR